MKRSCGTVAVTIDVEGNPNWWDDALTKDQRNSIRDRIDSICDDLAGWVPWTPDVDPRRPVQRQ